MRMSIGLACLTMSLLFVAQSLGLVPDRDQAILEGRKSLCESVAVNCCLAAQNNDLATIRATIMALVTRNASVLSAAVRKADGKAVVVAGNHEGWHSPDATHSNNEMVQVPILAGKSRWGTVEIRFTALADHSFWGWITDPVIRFFAFVAGAALLAFTFYLKRTLQHLDPSSVVPDRVRATLDSLAEGVLVLDSEERIVLANQAFAKNTGKSVDELQGQRAPEIQWQRPETESAPEDFPWAVSIREGVAKTGVMLRLDGQTEGPRTFAVNTTPILGADGKRRGALATFDDVTSIEKKNQQLQEMLEQLKESRDEIHRQNEELTLLATRDPLTSCLNRRSFFNLFETAWKAAQDSAGPLACAMVDIDHFKSINDTHGHSAGDQVLQQVSAILRTSAREQDLVCRYGGEEFCIVMPDTDLDQAMELLEGVRSRIQTTKCANLDVTASLGASHIALGAHEPRALLDQADKSLYLSKRNGRNRVTSFLDVPPDLEVKPTARKRGGEDTGPPEVPIPFHAVTALTSALGYRDARTGEHSRRVADLCVATARGLISERECYVLEVAALLHDIGKLGVPDAILLKPGPLTPDEWKIMGQHDRIGVEIISAAFSSPELTEIVRTHHATYAGNSRDPSLPKGDDIPLGARILTIADAYDAMVSDRVYRKGMSQNLAFAELRKFAGLQFDPNLVERFIEAVSSHDSSRHHAALTVSKQAALRIGLQIERLAGALDNRDFPNLAAMANRLAATASQEGVTEISQLAAELEACASGDPDLMNVVKLTTDLLELCRSTQSSYLARQLGDDEPAKEAAEVVSV
jgi:diguanylate cyclase (GGDEF)-like protein/PAS domain S-box-containing protein/putative nucleotidyltransferase with HDIG domain